jgi:hypothetical protein
VRLLQGYLRFVNIKFLQDEVGVLSLLMCKDNLVIEPSLWLEYATNEADPTFDTFVERKLT